MRLYLKTKDFSVTGETFELHLDDESDMLVTRPQPQNMERYYDSEAYISHTDSKSSFTDKLYQSIKRYSLRKKTQLIDSQIDRGKNLLDIGAGTGDFLVQAKSDGFEVAGIEPNERARTNAARKGIHLQSDYAGLANQKFDVITLWHVLEHLPDLEQQLNQISNLLKENGIVVVAVPNFKSYDAKHYGSFWAAYDVPRHLWHFSRNAISKIFDRRGMEVVSSRPMIFDSFYVSMLSEKYKGNRLQLINAFFVGLWSNIKAWSSKEYSSLIYIIKKKN